MARVKRAVNAQKKRRVVLERASGYRGQRSRLYRKAKEQVTHSPRLRLPRPRARKGDFRRLWIQRINAGARANGMTYNRFIQGLKAAGIEVDRRMLAELAVNDAAAFAALVEIARAQRAGAGRGRRDRRPPEPALTHSTARRDDRPCSTNPRSERVKSVRALSRRSVRARERRFLAEGPQAVREVVAAPARAGPSTSTSPPTRASAYAEIVDAAGRRRAARPRGHRRGARRDGRHARPRRGWSRSAGPLDVPLDAVLAPAPRLLVRAGQRPRPRQRRHRASAPPTPPAPTPSLRQRRQRRRLQPQGACARPPARLFHLPVVTGVPVAARSTTLRAAGLRVLAADGAGRPRPAADDVGPRRAARLGLRQRGVGPATEVRDAVRRGRPRADPRQRPRPSTSRWPPRCASTPPPAAQRPWRTQWLESGAWTVDAGHPAGARLPSGGTATVHDLHPDGLVVADGRRDASSTSTGGRARSSGSPRRRTLVGTDIREALPLQDSDGRSLVGRAPTRGAAWPSAPATASGCCMLPGRPRGARHRDATSGRAAASRSAAVIVALRDAEARRRRRGQPAPR